MGQERAGMDQRGASKCWEKADIWLRGGLIIWVMRKLILG